MKQFARRHALHVFGAVFLLSCLFAVWSPAAIIQAIVPSAVPVVNRIATGISKFVFSDSSENVVLGGSLTSGSGGGTTGALDLTGATSSNVVTVTVDATTAAGTLKAPGVTGYLAAINGTPVSGNCASWFSATQLGDAGAPCGSGGGGGAANPFCTFSGTATGCGTPASINVASLNASSIDQFLVQCFTGVSTTQTPVTILTYVYTTGSGIVQTIAPTFASAAAAGYCVANGNGSGGSGGGIATNTGPIASLPAAGNAGNLYFATDSVYENLRDNGASWDYFYHGAKVTPPGGITWAWNNQGSCVATQQINGALNINCPSNGASDNVRSYEFSASATPWTDTFRVRPLITSMDFNNAGLSLRESSTGKLMVFYLTFNATSLDSPSFLSVDTWNSVTSHASNLIQQFIQISGSTDLVLRITDQGIGGNLIFSYSVDNGISFLTWLTVARNSFFTTGPDKVGISVNPNNQSGSAPNLLTLVSVN